MLETIALAIAILLLCTICALIGYSNGHKDGHVAGWRRGHMVGREAKK